LVELPDKVKVSEPDACAATAFLAVYLLMYFACVDLANDSA